MNKGAILGGSLVWVGATAYLIWFLLTVSGDSPAWKWTLGSIAGLIVVIGLVLLVIGGIAGVVGHRLENRLWEEGWARGRATGSPARPSAAVGTRDRVAAAR